MVVIDDSKSEERERNGESVMSIRYILGGD